MTARLRPRRPRLRTRVVAAAAVAIVTAIVVLGAAVQVLLSRHLHDTLDRTLRDRAAQVAQLAATAPALLTSPSVIDPPDAPSRLAVEIVDRHGRIVTAPGAGFGGTTLPAGQLLAAALHGGRSGYGDREVHGRHLRVYVAPLADFGGPASGGAVVVASTTSDIDSTLGESRTLIILSALAAVVLVVPVAYVLAGRALRPLAELAAGAEVIERRGDPALRLPGAGADDDTPDEVARLADTLNRMLAALERAREGERRFVADASHELRNPLAALRGNAEYLARHGGDQAALDDLREDAERLSRLVDDLLALAHQEAAELPAEDVRMDELAEAAASGRVTARADDPGWVRGDRSALERALANLISNALRYGPAEGPVEVAVTRAGDVVRLTVSDTGAGIPAELAEAATSRFWRGEEARTQPGTGLGLALVRATAERHGGRLEVAGARFSIVLPGLRRLSGGESRTSVDEPEGASP